MQAELARGKAAISCAAENCCLFSYSYITKVWGFLRTHFVILKAGLSILCIKEVSKKGFSIFCTTSHRCKSCQGKEERDEK